MPRKGKREIILEVKGKKYNMKELEKRITKELKKEGVKYSEDANIYLNTENEVAYCVVNSDTIQIKL